jgi:hypothetical protein
MAKGMLNNVHNVHNVHCAPSFRHLPASLRVVSAVREALLVLLFRALSGCDDVSRRFRHPVEILERPSRVPEATAMAQVARPWL